MKFKGSSLASKMITSRRKYEINVKELQDYLKDKIDFDFYIDFQPADGHMILDIESNTNIAPLADCLSVIYSKGKLSEEDHKKLCI